MSSRRADSEPAPEAPLDQTPLPCALSFHVADPTTHRFDKISSIDIEPTLVDHTTPPPLPDPDEDIDISDLTDDSDDSDDSDEHTEPFDLLGARTRAGRLPGADTPRSSFFTPLPAADRENVLARFVHRSVPAGMVVIRRGETAHPLVLVAKGRLDVRVERPHGVPLQLGVVGVGEYIGEIALLARAAARATVVASTNAELMELAPEVFYEVCRRYPALWAALKDVAERRCRAYDQLTHGRDR